jgi:protein phosphatase-4 regulatory subunit 3
VDITQEIADQSLDDDDMDSDAAVVTFKLPPCEIDQIDEISSLFVSYLATPAKRERLALSIESEDYVKKLVELFQVCEDAENVDALHRLYPVFKSIFLLNKTSLFEILFSDDLALSVIGALEYDPALSKPAEYRSYLNNETRLKEVIPLTNVTLVQKIHQTYRMQYVMDVVLPTPPQSAIDDSALSTLTSFIFFNKMEIVTMIQV